MPLVPNPNHHLWRNGRLWWVAFTVVYDGWRQERVRRSLHTADIEEARRRRDDLLLQYAAAPNADVVACRPRVAAAIAAAPERESFNVPPAAFAVAADSSHV